MRKSKALSFWSRGFFVAGPEPTTSRVRPLRDAASEFDSVVGMMMVNYLKWSCRGQGV